MNSSVNKLFSCTEQTFRELETNVNTHNIAPVLYLKCMLILSKTLSECSFDAQFIIMKRVKKKKDIKMPCLKLHCSARNITYLCVKCLNINALLYCTFEMHKNFNISLQLFNLIGF